MEAKCSGTHFKVECQVDGQWFDIEYVFPDHDTALAFKHHEEEHGTGNSYRIVPTNATVNLPPREDDEDDEENGNEEGEPSDGDGSVFLVDWSALFELVALCPMAFPGPGDGDLERVYAQCEQGCCIGGRVLG